MLRFERWKIVVISLISVLGILYAAPNFLPRPDVQEIPSWLPHQTVNLGLDLQGGSHLLLEVETSAVVARHVENMVDEVRVALRGAQIGYTGLGRDRNAVVLKLRDASQADTARQTIRDALGKVSGGVVVDADETGNVTISLPEKQMAELQSNAVDQSIEIVRRRVDELGTTEPTIQRQGDDRILLQVPGFDDPERLKRLLGQTASLDFRAVDEATPIQDALQGKIPPGSELLFERATDSQGQEVQGQPIVVRKKVVVSGENLVDAQPTFQNGMPVVSIRFDSTGARRFADFTAENVGKRFAIVLDGKVISAPVVREPIPGGNGIISGSFTTQTANDLALLLRAGALPAPLKILEERTVGPSLGADSIAAGKVAGVVAIILVIGYMIATYGLFGVASTLAILINIALILAILSVLQATLTLPGIAGIVLTMGMAVDANVLIFERIREEVRNGRTPYSALDMGFKQALRTILDANITTLIAAVILFQFGSGPVRGFAVTLAVGIFTSVFTAVMLTRMLIVLWLRRTRPQTLPI